MITIKPISDDNFLREVNRVISARNPNNETTLIILTVDDFEYYYETFKDSATYIMSETTSKQLNLN